MTDTQPLALDQTGLMHLCDAFVRLLDPFGEVVLHDWRSQTISYISGQLSNRQVGDPSFVDDLELGNDPGPVFGPFRKTNPDGRLIKSISILFNDADGNPTTLLCFNIDTSRFEAAHALLSHFISIPEGGQDNPLADDWLENLNTFVARWRIENGLTEAPLSVGNRHRLISALIEKQVFERSKAADAVAAAIGVSRATVYNDLKLLEQTTGQQCR